MPFLQEQSNSRCYASAGKRGADDYSTVDADKPGEKRPRAEPDVVPLKFKMPKTVHDGYGCFDDFLPPLPGLEELVASLPAFCPADIRASLEAELERRKPKQTTWKVFNFA